MLKCLVIITGNMYLLVFFVLTEFLKTVQLHSKRYPTVLMLRFHCVVPFQVSIEHCELTFAVIVQDTPLPGQLNDSGTVLNNNLINDANSVIGVAVNQRVLSNMKHALHLFNN